MKSLLLLFSFSILVNYCGFAQTEFELKASQSMCITGKGPGQDGAKNPFAGQNCVAIVDNIGSRTFSIRVQSNGEIVKTIPIAKGETKKVNLLKGYELYFDTDDNSSAKARVNFEKMK
jgi:hypothetical protein